MSLYHPGVVEYLSTGAISEIHADLKELTYSKCLSNFSCSEKPSGSVTHNFHLKSAYESSLMPYTNYTYFFKVCLLGAALCRILASNDELLAVVGVGILGNIRDNLLDNITKKAKVKLSWDPLIGISDQMSSIDAALVLLPSL